MGTFADLVKKDGTTIPENKRKEFRERVEQLFQAGGMMEVNHIQLCGKKVYTMKPASMHEDGMHFHYNYFEDDFWESAGFLQDECCIYSNQIGWDRFNWVVVAAYALEEQYLNGRAIPMVNDKFIVSPIYLDWLNYLFPDLNRPMKRDPWEIFEAMCERQKQYRRDIEELQRYDWDALVIDTDSALGALEIKSVLRGTEEAKKTIINVVGKKIRDSKLINPITCILHFKELVEKYKAENNQSEEKQLSLILNELHMYYKQNKNWHEIYAGYDDKLLQEIFLSAAVSNAPALIVKILAEIYDKDFWELWDLLKDVARREYFQSSTITVAPVPTATFLEISHDDMILFWKDDGKIKFSDKLLEWFEELKSQYDKYEKTKFSVEKPLEWIIELMEYADKNYYLIIAIDDFFQETIEHLHDSRYLILWKLYDLMLHDPELEKAGSVIFVPDGPEHESEGIHYLEDQSRRRLTTSWCLMRPNEKNNKARRTFRRYMALVANRGLRKRVFGF